MIKKVTSLFGGPTGERTVNEIAVAALEELLEKARSGEIVGIAVAALHYDGCGSFQLAGRVGGYSMLGALDEAHSRVMEIVKSE